MDAKFAPRPARASFVRRLFQEVDYWVQEGLIGQEASAAIRSRYREPSPVDWRGRVVTVLTIMAASFLGLGVILFFASNWEAIPRLAKFILVSSVMSGVYIAGYSLRYERGYERLGEALIILGTILFGSAIFLVAQAFNMREHFPNGLLLWSLGILSVALFTRSPFVFALFNLAFIAWSWTETYYFHNWGPTTLLVTLGVIIPAAYKLENRYLVALGFATLGFCAIEGAFFDSTSIYGHTPDIVYIAMASTFGGMIYAAGAFQDRLPEYKKYRYIFQVFGLVFILVPLFLLSSPGLIHDFSREASSSSLRFAPISFFETIAMVLIILAMLVLSRVKKFDRACTEEIGACAVVVILIALLGIIILYAGKGIRHSDSFAILIAIIVNVVLLVLLAAIIFHGYRQGNKLLVNAALITFVAAAITRYFETFWDMMPRSVFFIGGGALLLVGGVLLEKQRRKLMGSPKEART